VILHALVLLENSAPRITLIVLLFPAHNSLARMLVLLSIALIPLLALTAHQPSAMAVKLTAELEFAHVTLLLALPLLVATTKCQSSLTIIARLTVVA